ncbi:hypothetical protein RFI_16703 [Reticulomyxa filosa]|uniref:Uncharacterized protein n=1 Tax=Reticulomyxa filosa TaxID=46433 RepID=X6N378_RETFI|nr:hypothetical protein RFI_16703 [Reticulomyxa filosa]|eukprot:ETO20516.1 hypothetical protein RFI_16703 [Reticulomyxa filosa]
MLSTTSDPCDKQKAQKSRSEHDDHTLAVLGERLRRFSITNPPEEDASKKLVAFPRYRRVRARKPISAEDGAVVPQETESSVSLTKSENESKKLESKEEVHDGRKEGEFSKLLQHMILKNENEKHVEQVKCEDVVFPSFDTVTYEFRRTKKKKKNLMSHEK